MPLSEQTRHYSALTKAIEDVKNKPQSGVAWSHLYVEINWLTEALAKCGERIATLEAEAAQRDNNLLTGA